MLSSLLPGTGGKRRFPQQRMIDDPGNRGVPAFPGMAVRQIEQLPEIGRRGEGRSRVVEGHAMFGGRARQRRLQNEWVDARRPGRHGGQRGLRPLGEVEHQHRHMARGRRDAAKQVAKVGDTFSHAAVSGART